MKYWLEKYPGASEDICEVLPESRERPLSTSVYFNSEHSHYQVTWQSVSGVLCFVGSAPISWTSKRESTINISSYSIIFCAGWLATEEAISLRYMLMSLGVPVKVAMALYGDNQGIIISFSNPDSDIKTTCGNIVQQVAGECGGQDFQALKYLHDN